MAEVHIASIADVAPIAENMREADAREVWLSAHFTPYEALRRSVELSDLAFTIIHDDRPVGIFGVRCTSVLGGIGIPWLLGTDDIYRFRKQFIKEGFRWLEVLSNGYRLLTNYVHEDNHASLKWLKTLGFTIMPKERIGPELAWFHKFERINHVRTYDTDSHSHYRHGGRSNHSGCQRQTH